MARIMEDVALQRAWREASSRLWIDATCPDDGSKPNATSGFNMTFTTFLRSCTDATTEWDGPTSQGLKERYFRPSKLGWRTASHYRVLRLGHALAFGSGRLSVAEADYLRARGYHGHVADVRRGSRRDVEGGTAVDFAFRYVGRRSGSRRAFTLASTATAFVERPEEDDVALGVTLATRYGLGIPFRRIGDAWFRPVVAPSGSGFLDEDAFADACAGGEPWTDDPHALCLAPGITWGTPTAVLEEAAPEGSDASLNAARRQEEVEACHERAGRLVSLGGMVHVACPEPVLVPLLSTRRHAVAKGGPSPRASMSLGWTCGRVDGETDFGLVTDPMVAQAAWPLSDTTRWPTFPFGQAAMAADVARAYAERLDVPYREADGDRTPSGTGAVQAMEAALLSGPMDDPTLRTIAPQRDRLLKALRSGDVGYLKAEARANLSRREGATFVLYKHRLVAALAETCALALQGRYEATPPFDEEADLAAMAP